MGKTALERDRDHQEAFIDWRKDGVGGMGQTVLERDWDG